MPGKEPRQPQRRLRRDFWYPISGGGGAPVLFCTRDDFCTRFGFRHGDLVEYGAQHPLKGWRAVVVGERGGRLWVQDEGSVAAHQLHAVGEAEVKAKYGLVKVGTRTLQAAKAPAALSADQAELLCTLPDLLVRINEGRELQHLVPQLQGEGPEARIGWAGVGYVHDGQHTHSVDNKVYMVATAVL